MTNAGVIKKSNGDTLKTLENAWVFFDDWNNDGKKDMVAGEGGDYSSEGTIHAFVYLNKGTNAAPVFEDSIPILVGGNPLIEKRLTPVMCDLNCDGKKDLIYGGYSGNLYYCENAGTVGNPSFPKSEIIVTGDESNACPPRVNFNDWDGDGDLDIILGDYGGDYKYAYVYLYRNVSATAVKPQGNETQKIAPVTVSKIKDRMVVHYSLSKSANVEIVVYSTSGKRVSPVMRRYETSGAQQFGWDPAQVSSGIYYVRLKIGADIRTVMIFNKP